MYSKLTEEQQITLNKYDKLFEEFLANTQQQNEEKIEVKVKPYIEFIDELLKLHNFTRYIYEVYLSKSFTGEEAIIYDLLIKTSQTTLSIYFSLKKYLERDALTLFRTLFELYLNITLIFKEDTFNRIRLYRNFSHVRKYLNFTKHPWKISNSDKQNLINNYNQHKNNYKPNYPKHWGWLLFKDKLKGKDPTLYDICDNLGSHYLKLYDNLNEMLNMVVHSISGMYVILDITDNVSCFTINCCSEIYQMIIDYAEIKDYEEIMSYFNLFYRICLEEKVNKNG